jgi:hypothetical protein
MAISAVQWHTQAGTIVSIFGIGRNPLQAAHRLLGDSSGKPNLDPTGCGHGHRAPTTQPPSHADTKSALPAEFP